MRHQDFANVGYRTESDDYTVYKNFLSEFLDAHYSHMKYSPNNTKDLIIDIDLLCSEPSESKIPIDLEIYENLTENFEEFHTILQNVVDEWTDKSQSSPYALDTGREIFYKPPSVVTIPQLAPQDINHFAIGKLLRFKGTIDTFRPFYSVPTLYHFLCRACDATYIARQPNATCKCAKKNRYIKRDFLSQMYFHLLIKIANNPAAVVRCYYILRKAKPHEFLFNETYIGEEVDILATAKLIEGKIDGETALSYALELRGIKLKTDRIITAERRKEIIETVQSMTAKDAIHNLSDSFTPHIYRLPYLKTLALLVAVGLKYPDPDFGELQPTSFPVLVAGDAGVGKTKTIRAYLKYFPKSAYIQGRSSTFAGVLGGAQKIEGGGYVIKIGQIVKSNNSFMIVDEADKMSEDTVKGIYTGISEGRHSSTNIAGTTEFTYNTNLWLNANPKEGKFDPNTTKFSSLTFRPDFLSRIHFVTIIDKAYLNDGKYDENAHDEYLDIRLGIKRQAPMFDEDFLYDYAMIVKEQPNPRETAEFKKLAKLYIKERQSNVRNVKQDDFDTQDSLTKVTIDERFLDKIRICSKLFARAVFSPTVTATHLDLAKDLYDNGMFKELLQRNITSLEILQEKIEEAEHTKIPDSPSQKRDAIINIIYQAKGKGKGEGEIEWEELMVKCGNLGINELLLEKELEILIRNGIIYEPRPGFYKKI